MNEQRLVTLLGSPFVAPVVLLLLVLIGYGHTLSVPFYFDDYSSILESPSIVSGGPAAVWQQFSIRFLGYMTFWANYQIGGPSVFGFHLVNVTIHLTAAILVYLLARQLVYRTSAEDGSQARWRMAFIPLVAATLFLVHPLQIQAVTYIVQRLASLAALFYVATLLFYIYGRVATAWYARGLWMGAALVTMGAALFTKQNTFTLPLAVLLLEWVLFGMDRRRLLFVAGLGIAVAAGLAGVIGLMYHINPFSPEALAGVLRGEASVIGRGDYFLLQLKGLFHYLGLYVWPVDLRVDYNPPVLPVHFGAEHLLFAAFHLVAIGAGVFLVRRAPLISFGILFFYIAHLVESSVLPIKDTFVEHRMYLPLVGLSIATADLIHRFSPLIGVRSVAIAAGLVSLLLLGATRERNEEWNDRLGFWEKNARLSPAHYRPWSIVAKEYLAADRPNDALTALQRASEAKNGGKPGPIRLDEAAVVTFVAALIRVGRMKDAMAVIDHTLSTAGSINPLNRSKLLTNRGNISKRQGALSDAEADYREAIRVYSTNPVSWNNLAAVLLERREARQAEEVLREGLSANPSNPLLMNSLEVVTKALGQSSAPPPASGK
ncbi:hypothetical protein [Endothiovibrio diazotrophicus]